MQAEVRYLPPYRRKGGILENIESERPNATRITGLERIFAQTNPNTQPRVYEGAFSFNGSSRGIMQPLEGVNDKWGQKVPQVPQQVPQVLQHV